MDIMGYVQDVSDIEMESCSHETMEADNMADCHILRNTNWAQVYPVSHTLPQTFLRLFVTTALCEAVVELFSDPCAPFVKYCVCFCLAPLEF